MLPAQVRDIVSQVRLKTRIPLGIHCHNDSATAVCNSLEAVEAGVVQVQGTINGYGERCGNADLIPIIANLKLKMGRDCVTDEQLTKLTEVSHFVAEVSNLRHLNSQPYAGESAFAHKAGVHINAMVKDSHSYEHLDPARVGNKRRVLGSELGGKSGILSLARGLNVELTKDDPKTRRIHKLLQELEMKGYHFEAAEASFELLLQKALRKVKEFFKLEAFRVVNAPL
jgi:2-isopropylmalate synthase